MSTTHTTAEIAAAALATIQGQELFSQSRCVDLFLDLMLSTDDPFVLWTLSARLDEIRHLTVVRADEIRADLTAIVDTTTGDAPEGSDRLVA